MESIKEELLQYKQICRKDYMFVCLKQQKQVNKQLFHFL